MNLRAPLAALALVLAGCESSGHDASSPGAARLGVSRLAVADTLRESSFALGGLSAPARIIQDRYGIPHVQAANRSDLYFAWGFASARDRLWQMLYNRQAADGGLWRWFGNPTLRADGGAQLFELRSWAERGWTRLARDPGARIALERYADGVNAWMKLCRDGERSWPAEVRALGITPANWRPSDSIVLVLGEGVLLDFDLPELDEARTIAAHGAGWIERRRRFESQWIYDTIPDSAGSASPHRSSVASSRTPAALPAADLARAGALVRALRGQAVIPGDERASDVFAVGAGRSASRAPLFANDPHLPLGTPGPLHAIHLSVPDSLEVAGFEVAGLPIVVSGRNPWCAWGVTSLGADVVDVYADSLSADGRSVRIGGRSFAVRSAPYDLRFRWLGLPLPPLGQSRHYTPHGPVVVFDAKRHLALSVRWSGLSDSVLSAPLIGFEGCRSAAEITVRLRTLGCPALNVVAADRAGHVRYQACGAVPWRGFDPGYGPLPGDGTREWRGVIPQLELPAWEVPANGFVVNCNNRPIGPRYFEPLPRYDWPHDRALRIAERLGALRRVTIDDMRSVQNDVHSRMADRFVPAFLAAVKPLEGRLDARQRAALDTLQAWDDLAIRPLVAPTILRGWYGAFQRRSRLDGLQGLALAALRGEAPDALAPGTVTLPGAPAPSRPETPAQAATTALGMALDSLSALLGPDPSRWTWARAHRAMFKSAFAGRRDLRETEAVPEDGDNSTPSVGASRLPWSSAVTHGPAMRHVVDLAVVDSSWAIVAPGNSGDRSSPHLADLAARWANHEYVPLYLSWPRIEQAKEREILLTPAPRPSAGR
jgi:penicillin amidase